VTTSLQTPPGRTPPPRPGPPGRRLGIILTVAATIAGGGLVAAAVAAHGPDRTAAAGAVASAGPSAAAVDPAGTAATRAAADGAAPAPAAPSAAAPAVASALWLWPFAADSEVAAWQRANREGGHQPWHLDPAATALGFAGHLGYSGIDRAVRSTVDGRDAHVAVGFRTPDGSLHTAADVHLIKVGAGADAPWEVVGTRDTTLTLTRPAYGSAATSPMTVGGRITGVDEQVVVTTRTATGGLSSPPVAVAAGGQQAPWSVRVSFRAAAGTVLTVAAATGGHVAAVERFAVTGVRVGPASRPRPPATDDVDGDGRQDTVSIPAPGTLRVHYGSGRVDSVSFHADAGDGGLQGITDADRDGRDEVFVHVGRGAYVDQTSVFRYADGHLRLVTLGGRQATLVSGASVVHGNSWGCRPPAAPIAQWGGTSTDGAVYRGTLDSYRFSGAALVLVASRPLTTDDATPPPSGCGEMRT
jgi:hypothetical protein